MNVQPLDLPDVRLITPRVVRDDRGSFLEIWRDSEYRAHDIGPFVQDNASMSSRGVVRGLHFQEPHGQGKLITVLHGRVFDVAVDVRFGSPTFRRWISAELSAENCWQLYIPPGFAHGFQALTDDVIFSYKCTQYYAPKAEWTVRWDDPALGIPWPLAAIVAQRDAAAPLLEELLPECLPRFRGVP
jgi:dTDP-4-dehydrorhamnose 3,5-epimerase